MKGLFITFEGPDGAGKTTQVSLLAEYLEKRGFEYITTREPGGTVISNKIRQILLDPEHIELKDQTEILLYASSRAQLVHEVILPELEKGKIVLCDRYIDASIAYQAFGLGIDRKTVEGINRFASSNVRPDRTYLLDISPELGRKRLIGRTQGEFREQLDRIEQRELEYHQRVYQGFMKLAEEEPNRIIKIKADQPIEQIFQQIKSDFDSFLQSKRNM
ncbi:dTMP kinase [Tepidibacillus fermentans]|uniref:Thymidylate kinase n=1 Tax=Tepidibacillus fermentans TaxID=1281767 RepID=A0A4V6NYU9_9BACI|nr:dTMP kinase [Tepidibacillus fermentans]TCS77952.1 dTMP kinase [Tepidibacillus fermentans]